MGVGISDWRLARAAAMAGALGVVSGTALDSLMVRRLQDGDPGGDIRAAAQYFPVPEIAERVVTRWWREEGRGQRPYRLLPMYSHRSQPSRHEVTVVAAFVEVWLARHGHTGPVGINLLTKVQFPTLATLYGAMLAGVDVVLMGAGIPRAIPAALDALAAGATATLRVDVSGSGTAPEIRFSPGPYGSPELRRPRFLPIVSSNALATMLARKTVGTIEGFVVEGPTAGGHNAPPRGPAHTDALGQPIYGERDAVDIPALANLGLPFWLAGGMGSPEAVARARATGAAGVQVGTLFAYCAESGMDDDLRRRTIEAVARGGAPVRTDPLASSTGYPFKVVQLEGTLACDDVYRDRERICDLGYLREVYVNDAGRIGYRCSAEPVNEHLLHGGSRADTEGRRCLCNALLATIGHGQVRGDRTEPPLITSGDALPDVLSLVRRHGPDYSARHVVEHLAAGWAGNAEALMGSAVQHEG